MGAVDIKVSKKSMDKPHSDAASDQEDTTRAASPPSAQHSAASSAGRCRGVRMLSRVFSLSFSLSLSLFFVDMRAVQLQVMCFSPFILLDSFLDGSHFISLWVNAIFIQ